MILVPKPETDAQPTEPLRHSLPFFFLLMFLRVIDLVWVQLGGSSAGLAWDKSCKDSELVVWGWMDQDGFTYMAGVGCPLDRCT